MSDKSPSDQARDLMARWNPPPKNSAMERLVGSNPPRGDTRATAAYQDPNLQHSGNAGNDSLDAGRMYADDEDDGLPEVPTDDDGNPDYDAMKNDDLKAHLSARDLPVSGKHAELVERLEEDDASDDDEEDDDDEE